MFILRCRRKQRRKTSNLRHSLVGLKRAVNQKSVVRRIASWWARLSGPSLPVMRLRGLRLFFGSAGILPALLIFINSVIIPLDFFSISFRE